MTQNNIVFIFLYSFYIFLIYFLAGLLKILVYQLKKAIFKQNICFIMNLKERGITVGDLLIIIIIITSTILIKSFSKDKKTTLNYSNQEKVSYMKNYYQKFI